MIKVGYFGGLETAGTTGWSRSMSETEDVDDFLLGRLSLMSLVVGSLDDCCFDWDLGDLEVDRDLRGVFCLEVCGLGGGSLGGGQKGVGGGGSWEWGRVEGNLKGGGICGVVIGRAGGSLEEEEGNEGGPCSGRSHCMEMDTFVGGGEVVLLAATELYLEINVGLVSIYFRLASK